MAFKTLDLVELVKSGRYFSEKRGEKIHIIDSITGESFVIFADADKGKLPSRFVESEMPNGSKVWAQEHLNLIAGGEKEVAFSPIMVGLICQRIAEGGSLTKVCKERGMPSYTLLCQWRRSHTWIDEHLEQARKDRAEYLRDMAMEEALKAEEDTVQSQSLKHEAYKWGAGVDNSKYSPRSKLDATISMPTQIIVQTGIDRTPKDVTPAPLKVEGGK